MTIESLPNRVVADDPTRPKTLAAAAKQFEALLIAQLLKSARESGSGEWTGEKDGPLSSLQEIAEQNLAEVLASQGGFGLADMIVSQIETRLKETQDGRAPVDK